jgi:hypothetical protein
LPQESLLGVWPFNETVGGFSSADVIQATPLALEGTAALSAPGQGRSGQPEDRALEFHTAGGSTARISDPAFLERLNQNNAATDRLTVVFWQRWTTPTVNNSSTVWFVSPSAGSGDRGFQAHLPWGNGGVYFDTSGCCATPPQRLEGDIHSVFPTFDWGQWHHVALIKDGPAKQIWINGRLFLQQTSDALPLLSDWTEVILGHSPNAPDDVLRGRIDDFAVFADALQPSHVAALASGLAPAELVLPPEQWPPVVSGMQPANGTRFHPADDGVRFIVSTVSPNVIDQVSTLLWLNGTSVPLAFTVQANRWEVVSTSPLEANRTYTAQVIATDHAGRSTTRTWTFDTFDFSGPQARLPIDLSGGWAVASHSTETSDPQPALLAIDGSLTTFSETPNLPGSFWQLELPREMELARLEISPPPGPNLASALDGLVLQMGRLQDQVLFQSSITHSTTEGPWTLLLPEPQRIRILRLFLPVGTLNGANDHRVALAEVRLFGDAAPQTGPVNLQAVARASQSSTASPSQGIDSALDGHLLTASQTEDLPNSHWKLVFDRSRPIQRIELVNPRTPSTADRLQGLTLRILNDAAQTVASTIVTNPGPSRTWVYEPPPDTHGRELWIGLENNAVNGFGDHVVSLAEVQVFESENYALGTPSYMVRLVDHLPPASNANDGQLVTFTETTDKTVDGYWETDLGESRALTSVRVVAMDPDANRARLTYATVRLFDVNHDSIWAQRLSGQSATFDVPLPGPLLARYVRVGFEDKQSTASGGVWGLRLREVQAFGQPASALGLLDFSATPAPTDHAPSSTRLQWRQAGLQKLFLYPGVGSVGGATDADGTGVLIVSPNRSTHYTLVGFNHQTHFVRQLTVEVDGQPLPPRISEFMASNRLTLRDGYGKEPDWIEIHNPNNHPLNLTGYGLSDNPSRPMKWVFPEVSLPPHGFLVVFASGSDIPRDPQNALHANFNLSADGESLVLTTPDGQTPVDVLRNYPAQDEDLSYGRTLDGTWAFLDPTPGQPNLAEAHQGWLSQITFTHERGFQDHPFQLELHHHDPATRLFYSLDGSLPSVPYSGPLSIDDTTTVRATVRRQGFRSPRVQTHTYLFLQRLLDSPLLRRHIAHDPRYRPRLLKGLTDLPSLSVSVPDLPDNAQPFSEYQEREGSVEILWPDETPHIQANCGVHRFGGAWTLFDKRGYRLNFRAHYGTRSLRAPLFNGFDHGFPAVDRFDSLDLQGGNHDMISRGFYMAARFTEDTLLDMGSLNPHGRFVHLFLNGQYWGQYHLRERLTDAFLADYLGGDSSDYVNVRGNDNVPTGFVLGTPEPPHRAPWDFVLANRGSYAALKDRVDLPHLIDFMLMWFYGDAEQEFRAAGSIEPGVGFQFWLGDADGFLRTSALNANKTGDPGPGGLFGALASQRHPDFLMLLADRIYRHFFHNGALTPARNDARLQARMDEIADSLVAECARWGYRTPNDWVSAAQSIRTGLFPQRTDNLLTMLRQRDWYPSVDPPQFLHLGGNVPSGFPLTYTPGPGLVYYTLDGSDPRLPGGDLSPLAVVWSDGTQPLLLTSPTWIQARRRTDDTWSAMAEAHFHPVDLTPPCLDWTLPDPHRRPQFRFVALSGETYEAQVTSSLDPPHWQTFWRTENASAGPQELPEPPQSGATQEFLRILWIRSP